ncbi:Putative LOC100568673, partial [Caligus rogercresseyi]
AESFYGLAENAFASNAGGSGGQAGIAGSCPAINPLSEAECAGTVSTCWSPGFTDTDCPNFGLCCFDGCQDTCVDAPQGQ